MQSLILNLMRQTVWKTKAYLWSEVREETINFKIPPLKCELLTFNTGEKKRRLGKGQITLNLGKLTNLTKFCSNVNCN